MRKVSGDFGGNSDFQNDSIVEGHEQPDELGDNFNFEATEVVLVQQNKMIYDQDFLQDSDANLLAELENHHDKMS